MGSAGFTEPGQTLNAGFFQALASVQKILFRQLEEISGQEELIQHFFCVFSQKHRFNCTIVTFCLIIQFISLCVISVCEWRVVTHSHYVTCKGYYLNGSITAPLDLCWWRQSNGSSGLSGL